MEGDAKSDPNISLLLFNDPRTRVAAVSSGVDSTVVMVLNECMGFDIYYLRVF